MKLVRSEGPNDCGICVVATVLGVTWGEARRMIFGNLPKRSYTTRTKQLVKALREAGRAVVTSTMRDSLITVKPVWDDITVMPSSLAIVRVRPPRERGNLGHWVIWNGKKVYDPQSGRAWPPEKCPWQPSSYMLVLKKEV